jgi:hypothetical protein
VLKFTLLKSRPTQSPQWRNFEIRDNFLFRRRPFLQRGTSWHRPRQGFAADDGLGAAVGVPSAGRQSEAAAQDRRVPVPPKPVQRFSVRFKVHLALKPSYFASFLLHCDVCEQKTKISRKHFLKYCYVLLLCILAIFYYYTFLLYYIAIHYCSILLFHVYWCCWPNLTNHNHQPRALPCTPGSIPGQFTLNTIYCVAPCRTTASNTIRIAPNLVGCYRMTVWHKNHVLCKNTPLGGEEYVVMIYWK